MAEPRPRPGLPVCPGRALPATQVCLPAFPPCIRRQAWQCIPVCPRDRPFPFVTTVSPCIHTSPAHPLIGVTLTQSFFAHSHPLSRHIKPPFFTTPHTHSLLSCCIIAPSKSIPACMLLCIHSFGVPLDVNAVRRAFVCLSLFSLRLAQTRVLYSRGDGSASPPPALAAHVGSYKRPARRDAFSVRACGFIPRTEASLTRSTFSVSSLHGQAGLFPA